MPEATPIALLRRAAEAAQRGEPLPPDAAAWFVRCAKQYEAGAESGTTLDSAMGLSRPGGAGPWWVREGRARRDAILRELQQTCYAGQPPADAARAILRLADKRRRSLSAPRGAEELLIDAALRAGPKMPKYRQLQDVLCNSLGGVNCNE